MLTPIQRAKLHYDYVNDRIPSTPPAPDFDTLTPAQQQAWEFATQQVYLQGVSDTRVQQAAQPAKPL